MTHFRAPNPLEAGTHVALVAPLPPNTLHNGNDGATGATAAHGVADDGWLAAVMQDENTLEYVEADTT